MRSRPGEIGQADRRCRGVDGGADLQRRSRQIGSRVRALRPAKRVKRGGKLFDLCGPVSTASGSERGSINKSFSKGSLPLAVLTRSSSAQVETFRHRKWNWEGSPHK